MNGPTGRNRNALLAFVCAALAPFGLEPIPSQAGPMVFKSIRGTYTITNNDPTRPANDFHAKIAFGGLMVNNPAVFFTGGSTDGPPPPPVGPPAPWFRPATKDNLQGWFFNYFKGDNVTPLPPGSAMTFTYMAKLFPGVNGLNPALDPKETYLTFTDAMGKSNRLPTGVASAGVVDVTDPNKPKRIALNLVNPGGDPLVLTNVQVWADSSLGLDAASFVPSASNSTLYYSASSLTLGPDDTFSVPSFTVNDPFAPVIFEASVTDQLDPGLGSFELLAGQNVAAPEPASLALLGTGTVGLLGFTRRRRKPFAVGRPYGVAEIWNEGARGRKSSRPRLIS